jgi:hypothetical protein
VQQALAKALTKPSSKASGKASGPMLADWSVSVTHCVMWNVPCLSHFLGQHPAPAEGPHPPALEAARNPCTSFVSVMSPEIAFIPRPLTIAKTAGKEICPAI